MIDYTASSVLVRGDLVEAHRRIWRHLGAPGTWWTSELRVEIAGETRNARACSLCERRRAALSPYGLEGSHDSLGKLPNQAVEVVHRVVTDPGRIAGHWVEGLLEQGMTDCEYVETLGVAVATLVVDTFTRAIGCDLHALPEAQLGEPSRQRPPTAEKKEAHVPMIPVSGLLDDYADLYDTRHFVPHVHRGLSLVPEETRAAMTLMEAHYFPYEQVPRYTDQDHDRSLTKCQMELLASRVSMLNECFY